jgi:hypothetical protein
MLSRTEPHAGRIVMSVLGASPTLVVMSRQVLTKRRAVDLCRTATCLCLAA